METIIVSAAVVSALVFTVRKIWTPRPRDKRSGGCGAGACSSCSAANRARREPTTRGPTTEALVAIRVPSRVRHLA